MNSSNNTYKNSDRKKYGAFLYVSGYDMNNGRTNLYDTNSRYEEGLSLGGGAIYCSMCNIISVISSTFTNNYSKFGGAMIIAFDLAFQAT